MSAFFLEHPKETDLALFAGGESGLFARWRIERHVESCPQCQQIAADFFRLPDQLNELADLPSVDWQQMAMAIESGVRADAAVGQPARRYGFLPPLAWQAGLVAATAVVGVFVVRYANQAQPEPELIAVAQIESSAPRVEEQQEIVEVEPARTEVAAAAPQSKAVEVRQTLASDIAAPAAPPPPAPAALNEAVDRRVDGAAQPVAAAAESSEGRLRSDAASRVGAVSALAVSGQAGGFAQARVAWAQLPVDTVNFADAPVSLSDGSTAFAGAIVKTPSVAAQNRSDRTVSSFELAWIVGDADSSATALIQRQGISMVPGAVTSSGGERSWRLPAGIVSATMRVYLSAVSFDDGGSWTPSPEQIASSGLIEPGTEYPPLELLPPIFELDDRP
ncbi:MAG: hypothetical protein O3A53_19015 [Acidobacteria bacterium]|nr:hypothetical protein [Acidobacteriota bacterium]MDA1236877.1 hypothetical protein [Acidobacteriota bacterium]